MNSVIYYLRTWTETYPNKTRLGSFFVFTDSVYVAIPWQNAYNIVIRYFVRIIKKYLSLLIQVGSFVGFIYYPPSVAGKGEAICLKT